VRAKTCGASDRHGGAYPEGTRLVRGRRDDTPTARIGAHHDGTPTEFGSIALLDGGVERVHVDVDDGARTHERAQAATRTTEAETTRDADVAGVT
jgi:hypothetical protein